MEKLYLDLINALGNAEPPILLGYQHHLTLIESMDTEYKEKFIKAIINELKTQKV